MEIADIEENIEKKYLDSQIIAFQFAAENSHCYEENSCYQQSRF